VNKAAGKPGGFFSWRTAVAANELTADRPVFDPPGRADFRRNSSI
jgi:hypothetical protein